MKHRVRFPLARLSLVMTCLAILLLNTPFANAQSPPVSDGILLWLDATDPATLFQDEDLTIPASFGDPVGGWADKSGNEYHATQFDEIAQPEYASDVMNGQPAVRLDSADADGMSIDGLFLDRPYTAFIVNQYYGPTRGRTLQSQDINWLHGLWGGNPAHYAEGWVSRNIPADEGFVYIADATGDIGGDSTFFLNGTDRTSNSSPAGIPGALGIASVGLFPGEVSDADISEILIYEGILTADELTSTRDYLYAKYDAEMIDDGPPPPPNNTVLSGEIGAFTGGDPGEGLDFEGAFVYALDVGGFGGSAVGDAEFTDASILGMDDGESEGATITVANEILAWHAPDYGDSADDDELEIVMESIRWNVPPGLEVDLELEQEGQYQLQLLFAENCCVRGFDITVEGELAVDNAQIEEMQDGIANTAQGVYFRDTVTVTDGVLNIELGGSNPNAPDNNPILNGLTLEFLGAGVKGDYNENGMLDAGDLDVHTQYIQDNDLAGDVNGDGVTDTDDRVAWTETYQNSYLGDSNFDGEFNSSDFVFVFAAGKYESGQSAGYAEGDWDGDGVFVSSDFIAAFSVGGYEAGPRVAAVPEPSSAFLILAGLIGIAIRRRSVRA